MYNLKEENKITIDYFEKNNKINENQIRNFSIDIKLEIHIHVVFLLVHVHSNNILEGFETCSFIYM